MSVISSFHVYSPRSSIVFLSMISLNTPVAVAKIIEGQSSPFLYSPWPVSITNADGSFQCTVPDLTLGSYFLWAWWAGGSGRLGAFSQFATTEIVPAPTPTGDFTISVSPSSATLKQGQSAEFQVIVTSIDGFSSPVSLSYPTDLFPGAFTPWSITPPPGGSAASRLVVNVGATVPPRSYTLMITGTGDASLTYYEAKRELEKRQEVPGTTS